MLLYDRWKEIVAARPSESALTSIRSGQEWTFAELDAWAESFEPSADSALTRVGEREVSTADGFSVELIALTLRAWRRDELLCPVDGMAPDGELFRGIPEAICHVKVTSGSTGKPRLILFRPEQLAADADNIVSTMGLRPDWPNLGIISMAHSYGFSNLVLPLLLHGIPLIWCGDALPGAVATCTQCTKVEKLTLPAVPAMWRTWQQAGILSDRIRLAISAGAPLPLELEQEIHAAHGIKVHNFYGASECGGIAYDRTETPRGSAERAGTAMDNVKLSLTDDGCLEVRGSAVGECYWPDEGESGSVTLRDGSFVSSDLAELVTSGPPDDPVAVILSGRRDDLINIAGKKVSPARVEEEVLKCPGVRHAVVFGVDSLVSGRAQETVACVNVAPEFDVNQARRRLADSLSAAEMPRHWWVCQDLQPDSRGKISRRQWRERYLTEPMEARSRDSNVFLGAPTDNGEHRLD